MPYTLICLFSVCMCSPHLSSPCRTPPWPGESRMWERNFQDIYSHSALGWEFRVCRRSYHTSTLCQTVHQHTSVLNTGERQHLIYLGDIFQYTSASFHSYFHLHNYIVGGEVWLLYIDENWEWTWKLLYFPGSFSTFIYILFTFITKISTMKKKCVQTIKIIASLMMWKKIGSQKLYFI